MQSERITDSIYVFTSDTYAQVTAGVVLTSVGAVLIDTLVYPEETKRIRRFIYDRLDTDVKYVINTHFHADHTTGTSFFNGATVIAHEKCRQLLKEHGLQSLENARQTSPEMQEVVLVLPDVVFNDRMTLFLGDKTLQLWSTPGHSPDSIVCLVEEDQVLFAADTLMPVPYFVGGSHAEFLATLQSLEGRNFETVVQGHGEIILRGEIQGKITKDIDYLKKLYQFVEQAVNSDSPQGALDAITVEKCGKSRVLLNGMVEQLHHQNVTVLAEQLQHTTPTTIEDAN
ncbi:MAG: MBL fold metallo-hydrolase [Aggregatilineales bacterium]